MNNNHAVARAEVPGTFATILDEATEGELLALPDNEPELLAIGDRLLRELADCRDERGANSAALKVEADRLSDAYEELDLPLERREARLLAMLEQVAQALPLRGKKSRALPFGVLAWRTVPARLEVVDEKVTLEWIKRQDFGIAASLVREVKTLKIAKDALDKYTETEGIIPEGCVQHPAEERFSAKPSEPHA